MKQGTRQLDAFFLAAEPGTRFALFHPACGPARRGAILYVHPFAEELNKSRRMAALQARAFARAGFSVLQLDLYGCGDSSGDFADARWEIWKNDVVVATRWLQEHVPEPLHLWGLRLGTLLAMEAWQDAPDAYTSAVLWQPVLAGESQISQFLRLAVAADALRPSDDIRPARDLRGQLEHGETVEVAGYLLAPELAREIQRRKLDAITIGGTVRWLDLKRAPGAVSPATQRTLDAWRSAGVPATYVAVDGDAFWSSFDIIEVPALIDATTALYAAESK